MRPIFSVVLILDTAYLFQLFTPIYVMTGGNAGPLNSTLNLSLKVFIEAFANFRFGLAAAIAIMITVAMLVAAVVWT